MGERRSYSLQLVGRAAVLLATAYTLTLGGTFNGILIASVQQFSLMLITVGAAAWLLATWWRPLEFRTTLLDTPLLLWGTAYTISTLAHPSERAATGLWYAGWYTGLWFVLVDLRRRGLSGRWITDAALLTAIPLNLLALIQVIDWFPAWAALNVKTTFTPPRPPSALGNPNTLGSVLAMLLPLGLARMRWSPRRPDRGLWAVWNLITLLILYLTYSRGAWFAALSAVAIYGVLALYRAKRLSLEIWKTHWHSRRMRFGLLAAGVMILILLAAALSAFDTPRRETGSRLHFYDIAWQSFRDHPFTGTGPFTFGLTLLEHRSIPPHQPHSHAHNLVLNIAAEMGLPGLVALGVTVLVVIRRGWHRMQGLSDPAAQAHRAACGAALVAFGVHQWVDMPSMFPAVFLLMLGILAAGIVPDHEEIAPIPDPQIGRPARAARSTLDRLCRKAYRPGITILWGTILFTGWWATRLYADYTRAERWLVSGDTRRGAALLGQVMEAQTHPLYQAEYGYTCGLLAAEGDESLLPSGIEAYRRALGSEAPHADWWANLAVLYWQAGNQEAALTSLTQAVHYAPESPDLWFNLGLYYDMSGQPNLAREAYRRTLDLSPVWGTTQTWIVSELRRDMLAREPVPPTPYLRAVSLWQAGQQSAAVGVLEATIKRDPTEPGPYARLARLFVQGGNFERARDYLDAAQVLARINVDRAWINVVKAEMAAAQGDQVQADSYRTAARDLIWPEGTGYALPYGSDVAYYQFLRVRVPGMLLPSLVALSPEPELIDLLR